MKYKVEWIIPNAQKNQMEPILLTLEEGGRYKEEIAHNGQEFGYVLEGEINIHLGENIFQAKKGESFYYNSGKNHYLSNCGKGVAKIIWVATPPSF